jgi:glycosyltransferase involved in cell wall biosynthesis
MNYKKCLLIVASYNNGDRLKKTLDTKPKDFPIDIAIVDDGTTDNSFDLIKDFSCPVIRHDTNMGIGVSIRDSIKYARENGYEILALIPGNFKNTIAEVTKLVEPILEGKADYIQGSRYLPGSRRDYTPLFRLVMVKLIAFFLSIITFRKITDSMEGFRAFRLSILDDPDIDIEQEWLDRYGLEIYLFFKVTKGRKYRYKEVPISKIYPKEKKTMLNKKGIEYSKIKPFTDWWDILRPVFYLWFGIRK